MERDILNRKITKKNGEKVPIRTLKLQEQLKYEIADELGLFEKIEKSGWGALTASESGRIGGMIRKRNTQNKKKDLRRYMIHSWTMYHMMNGENILFPC